MAAASGEGRGDREWGQGPGMGTGNGDSDREIRECKRERARDGKGPSGTRNERLLSRGPGYGSAVVAPVPEEEELRRRRLKYLLMSPCEKYQACGRRPVKLVLQLTKIILVTVQVTLPGTAGQGLGHWGEDTGTPGRGRGDFREEVRGRDTRRPGKGQSVAVSLCGTADGSGGLCPQPQGEKRCGVKCGSVIVVGQVLAMVAFVPKLWCHFGTKHSSVTTLGQVVCHNHSYKRRS
ncbi:hypothetical protein DUI87_32148 [Hirundo rustica rustica]|uniref:Uncharacterized protein n=1 Tax=Hirundo rustica rustica TaxID=333673 RepID=A0A3M0IR05_HIRRU|nr:hypothetical protein DUI87_32148 [Hirundo rustica rustica]